MAAATVAIGRKQAATAEHVPVPSPRTRDEVLAEAERTAGVRLRGSPWSTWFGSTAGHWSAVYVTWLLRHNQVPPTADVAALHAGLVRAGQIIGAPAPGALIFYSRGPGAAPHHVGLVTSVTAGVPQTLEGDCPTTVVSAERFVRRLPRPSPGVISYGLPPYA